MKTIVAQAGYVFAVPEDRREQVSPGGIVIPELEQKDRRGQPRYDVIRATVVACSGRRIIDGVGQVPSNVRENDRIIFAKERAAEAQINGRKMWVVREEDIFGMLRETDLTQG